MINPNLLPIELPPGFDFANPSQDPDTIWPPERREVYQDPNNDESAIITDWRYTDAKQAWAAKHPFVPNVKPWNKATAPQWQLDWIANGNEPATFAQAPKPAGWTCTGHTTDGGDWTFAQPVAWTLEMALANLDAAVTAVKAVAK